MNNCQEAVRRIDLLMSVITKRASNGDVSQVEAKAQLAVYRKLKSELISAASQHGRIANPEHHALLTADFILGDDVDGDIPHSLMGLSYSKATELA